MNLEMLQIFLYFIVGASVAFYVMLDGFDLGVGSIHFFARNDKDRRIFLNSIGPFWDGNEVWLVVIGGALFVGFPDVYAVAFSGCYDLFMALLAAIIARVCGIEFRSKHPSKVWRSFWDGVFCFSSLLMTFGIGLLLGNLVEGLPVNQDRELFYSLRQFFTPYAIGVGLISIALFAMHGNTFLLMKTEGELQKSLRKKSPYFILAFGILFTAMTIWTWLSYPYMFAPYLKYPFFWAVPLFFIALMTWMTKALQNFRYGKAFFLSMLSIASIFAFFAIGTFPNLITSTLNPSYSLTLYNASSSQTTLEVAFIIAIIGIPLVLAYGFCLYYIFHGKTKLHDHSY